MAIAAARRINPNQDVVVRRIDRVGGFPAIRMAGRTGVRITEPGIQGTMAHRRTDQSIGAGVMTGRTAVMNLRVTAIGESNCRIVVTDQTGGFTGDITGGDVVNSAVYGQFLVRMAIQAMGRGDSRGDDVLHLLPRTIVTGRTGTVPIGGDIVLDTLDLSPVRHHVTVTAELSRCTIGEVVRTNFYQMTGGSMERGTVYVAGVAGQVYISRAIPC